ncbi:hypothetical protein BJF86_14055 [Serinicoccus sp. CNJ-927]|uniref:LiaF domain-containing protein n=1 Tax=unclassified Serinicoccus TaxID=2643101 RepID=UPI0009670348|nr:MULTISPECIES: LiaF domain-containing protein [unclassified Serinicoccus]OLT16752.1 hypothetical protein BJF80_05385 [Serinicoccus sp. CUA-874]OLT42761.1 hypothetical protein BJF86_14055 [Serinicoccus sp. CNJ-927]
MPDPAAPDPSAQGPSDVPPDWRPDIPVPGQRPAPREELPAQWRGNHPAAAADRDAPVPMRAPTQTLGTLMGDVVRTGAWDAAERTTTMLLVGDVKLDLREVVRPGETLEISSFTGMGDIRIAVPPGTRVELSGFNLLGDLRHDVDPQAQSSADTGACVRINATSLLGDVSVRTMPPDDGTKPPRGWRWTRKR